MNNDVFLKLYNDIENQIILKYKLPDDYQGAISYYIKKVLKDRESKVKLDQARRLRNFLVHEDVVKDYEMFMVTEDVILFLKNILYQLVDPITAYDICTKKENLYYAKLDDLLINVMKIMKEKSYSHIPVVNKHGKITGVFSESTMFSYIISMDGNVTINNLSKIEEYKQFIELSNHSSERYLFVSSNCEVREVINLFKKYEESNKKLKMIFVTNTGKENETVLGIITPRDILKL